MNRLRKFVNLPIVEKRLLLEATLFLFAAKVLLIILPFKHCIKLLSFGEVENRDPELVQLMYIKKAIHRTQWLMFWRNKCIVMCVASRWMLRRRQIPSSLSLGVVFDEDKKLKAHAWIKAGDFHLVEKDGNFYELFHF